MWSGDPDRGWRDRDARRRRSWKGNYRLLELLELVEIKRGRFLAHVGSWLDNLGCSIVIVVVIDHRVDASCERTDAVGHLLRYRS